MERLDKKDVFLAIVLKSHIFLLQADITGFEGQCIKMEVTLEHAVPRGVRHPSFVIGSKARLSLRRYPAVTPLCTTSLIASCQKMFATKKGMHKLEFSNLFMIYVGAFPFCYNSSEKTAGKGSPAQPIPGRARGHASRDSRKRSLGESYSFQSHPSHQANQPTLTKPPNVRWL